MLSIISPDNKQLENDIQSKIFNCISENEDFIFDAGAGSGKTYALIESLRFLINKFGMQLKLNNQKIACVTYTNIATEQISSRLGNSELVDVSTIHELLWQLIKNHPEELLIIHIEKLNYEIKRLSFDLLNADDEKIEKIFRAFRHLSEVLKNSFYVYVIEIKDKFYKAYDKNSKDFRAEFESDLNEYPNVLKSVVNFKKLVSTIYKVDNYKKCLDKIESNECLIVKYDSNYNTDLLHKMIISHDTLIEYAERMIREYPLLKKIIIDTYPYVFIDEYQDTNPLVIKITQQLSLYSKSIKRPICIGYFGDIAQNIYDVGVGSNIENKHPNLSKIKKEFNRRSYTEIIDIINKIRSDEIEQKSIYEDSNGGDFQFFANDSTSKDKFELLNDFIASHKALWKISKNNKLNCLVLTNKIVAKLSGFENIYNVFAKSDYYKKNYDKINSELLSKDFRKLGRVQSHLLKIVKLKYLLESPKMPIDSLLSKDIYSNLSFRDLKELIKTLQSIRKNTLSEYIYSLQELYEKSEVNSSYRKLIKPLLFVEQSDAIPIHTFLLGKLFPNLEDEDAEKANDNVNELLSISIEEYLCWYEFITETQDSEVVYHTYHGTKGEEFDNVIVFLEHSFGIQKNKFKSYFLNVERLSELNSKELVNFENTKNLLYVACSRAIKNLHILYLDDSSEIKDGINRVFGEISPY
jgi:DNA helicase-2/ATP-dependent DNA helicase PcrA